MVINLGGVEMSLLGSIGYPENIPEEEEKVFTLNQIIILKGWYLDWFKDLHSDFFVWCDFADKNTKHTKTIQKYYNIQNKEGHHTLELIYDKRESCWEFVVFYKGETVYSLFITEEGEFTTNLYVQNLPE